jgi:PAS domain S-box-containing protein
MNKPRTNVDDGLFADPALFRELMNRSNDNLSVIDLNTGRYLYVNEMTCRSTGYTPEEFRKMTVADIDPTVTTRWDPDKERKRRKKISVFVREGMIKRKDGICFPVEINSSILRIDGSDYMVATSRDITERKAALEALRSARDGFEQGIKERTAELIAVNESLRKEIATRSRVERALRVSQNQLQRQKGFLEHKNIALSEMLKQIEWEKAKVETNVAINTKEILIPLLDKMKLGGASGKYISLLKDNLKKLTTQFGRLAAFENAKLTPREVEIATMLRSGLTSKEISHLLHITLRSAEWHRYNIRKKLGLKGKKQNLRTVLMES